MWAYEEVGEAETEVVLARFTVVLGKTVFRSENWGSSHVLLVLHDTGKLMLPASQKILL